LCDAAATAATDATGGGVDIRVRNAFDAAPDDVLWADALLLATPAHFGYMSGALKDFFERIYRPCLEQTPGMPTGSS
jgi:multimeric flavodoxin WrbA